MNKFFIMFCITNFKYFYIFNYLKYISVKINLKNYYKIYKINNMEKNNKFHLNLDMFCIKK